MEEKELLRVQKEYHDVAIYLFIFLGDHVRDCKIGVGMDVECTYISNAIVYT